MKKYIMILSVLIVCVSMYGMTKNQVFDDILKNGYGGEYSVNIKEENKKREDIIVYIFSIEIKNKSIGFKNPNDGLEGALMFISYDNMTVDRKEYTISFYKADGRLIITVQLLNDKGDVKITGYGEWMINYDQNKENEYKRLDIKKYMKEELVRRCSFESGGFVNPDRIYKSQYPY